MKYYTGHPGDREPAPGLLASTGYTGEDGFELFVRPEEAERSGAALTAAGAGAARAPRGARRRERSGSKPDPLYGNELGPDLTPFNACAEPRVNLTSPATSSAARRSPSAGGHPAPHPAGRPGSHRRVPRHGYHVLWDGLPAGMRGTSGAPSPTLGRPIAMAYLDPDVARAGAPSRQAGEPAGSPSTSGAAPSLYLSAAVLPTARPDPRRPRMTRG